MDDDLTSVLSFLRSHEFRLQKLWSRAQVAASFEFMRCPPFLDAVFFPPWLMPTIENGSWRSHTRWEIEDFLPDRQLGVDFSSDPYTPAFVSRLFSCLVDHLLLRLTYGDRMPLSTP